MYTAFVSRCLFPLHEKLKKHSTVAVHKAMEKNQWIGTMQLAELQQQRLHALIQHCYLHVPYYRRIMEERSLTPNMFNQLDALQALPFLDKETIRNNTDALKADNAQGLASFNTGGSSGTPLTFYIGNRRVSHDVAAKWRATRWWGVDIGDPEIVIWGSPIELGAQDRIRQLRDFAFRTHLLEAFEMSPAKLDGFIEKIQTVKPKMLFGYPSALAKIAAHAEQQSIDMRKLGIKVAFVTSEVLYDEQRDQIERVFNCPVANGYGGRDAGFIAHQCPEGNMHITADDILVEIINEDGQPSPAGETGEVVVTHLATHDFPFIRYKTGDIGALDDKACRCGRSLPVLKSIQGRSTDFVVTSDGTLMHGLALIYILRDLPTIREFKIVQESRELTRIMLVVKEALTEEIHNSIASDFRARLGGDVQIDINTVKEIPAEKSGKYRYVVSHAHA